MGIPTPWIVIETDLGTLPYWAFAEEWVYGGAHEWIGGIPTSKPSWITLDIPPTDRLSQHLLCLHDRTTGIHTAINCGEPRVGVRPIFLTDFASIPSTHERGTMLPDLFIRWLIAPLGIWHSGAAPHA